MAGEMPPNLGEGSSMRPGTGPWTPPYPAPPAPRAHKGIAVTAMGLAVIAVLTAATALVVVLARPTNTTSSTSTPVHTYSAADVTAAQKQLCDTYKLAAKAVQVDTNGNDKALARIATTNGAVMLEMAAASPALDASSREAAHALAGAYTTLTAKGSSGVANDSEFQSALDNIAAKDAVMKKLCGGH